MPTFHPLTPLILEVSNELGRSIGTPTQMTSDNSANMIKLIIFAHNARIYTYVHKYTNFSSYFHISFQTKDHNHITIHIIYFSEIKIALKKCITYCSRTMSGQQLPRSSYISSMQASTRAVARRGRY